ncbi:hypothetical protein EXU57_14620 [Segetibacter sp. 3557_3]|uniref:hypothetical protein n=1 Tax=Segetibacter sp. 3557_3 TaxID=2547429 RepID=UPI0010584853|nr:hypothetical protein [Segetibacter sp. 3557_3]TDH24572.1 hypothetical protein EXU57_14620 [Segetibacter sp. 3557_3]
MKKLFSLVLIAFFMCACSNNMKEVAGPSGAKTIAEVASKPATPVDITPPGAKAPATTTEVRYTIYRGQHYCTPNVLKLVTVSEMRFTARFDETAQYDLGPGNINQYDINKLYGFSEGYAHQHQSARIGWRWSDGALRLFAYVYNAGVREPEREITTVTFGATNTCSIRLAGNTYVFTVNGISVTVPRATSTSRASGYQLYPYFGGDEVAPHDINIWIKNL